MSDELLASTSRQGVSFFVEENWHNDVPVLSVLKGTTVKPSEKDEEYTIVGLFADDIKQIDKTKIGAIKVHKIVNSATLRMVADLLNDDQLFDMDCCIKIERQQTVNGKQFVSKNEFKRFKRSEKAEQSEKISDSEKLQIG